MSLTRAVASTLIAVICGCVAVKAQSVVPTAASQRPAWQKIPIISPEAKKAGISPGGEGGQWPRGPVVVSASDPDFLLLPIDVGGLYRSVDGGKNWNLAMQGWSARGANGFAIDPRNANRVLGIGGNSMDWNTQWGASPHGIYFSTDKARSWKQVLAVRDGFGGRVIFDPSSFDAARGYCSRAYYSAPLSGLFRSEDGGESWQSVSRVAAQQHNDKYNAALLAVAKSGLLFLAGKEGVFRSRDHGQSFEHIYKDGAVWGLTFAGKTSPVLLISGVKGVLASRDDGASFSALPAAGIERETTDPIRDIAVSPSDPQRIFCWVAGKNWNPTRYVSHDGGQNFSAAKVEKGQATLPLNARNGFVTWHSSDANIAYGLGGDWVTKSSDGGKTFTWWNNGNNGIMLGGGFNFSSHEPNTVFLAFQDYNGAFTTDGGATWNYRDVSGKGWGGYCYGGFAVDKNVMWAGDSEHWGPPRRLRISRDGGKTWNIAKDADGKEIHWNGPEVSFADPKNKNNLFASNWRSADKGVSWQRMDGCEGVYGASADGALLYGRKGRAIVSSRDGGADWEKIAEVPGGTLDDIAFDHKRNRWYAVSEERLRIWENSVWRVLETPKNQRGGQRVMTVAVDPVNPDIVYAGGPNNIYASHATVFRSTDAGATWMNLTRGDGPHEVSWIRVHPKTREAWVAGQCFGMWKIAAPTQLGATPKELADAPRSPAALVAQPLPEPGDPLAMTTIIRDFGGVDYTFGPSWHMNNTVRTVDDNLQVDATEGGGGGVVLHGFNIHPNGETHLAIRLKLLPGNKAGALSVNIMRPREEGEDKSIQFDLTKFNEGGFSTQIMPLPEGKWNNVQQIQIMGANWSGGAQPLKIVIDRIGTLTPGAISASSGDASTQFAKAPAGFPLPQKEQNPLLASTAFFEQWPNAWRDSNRNNIERAKKGGVNVLFLGDSITDGWDGWAGQTGGSEIWKREIEPLGAANFAMGGDGVQQVLWRVTEGGEWDAFAVKPKVVVLMIGVNNFWGKGGSNDEIARGIGLIVEKLRTSPVTKILLLGVLPTQQNADNPLRARVKNVNAKLQKLAGEQVKFLDMGAKFLQPDGTISKAVMHDYLHLTPRGYEIWRDAMLPTLKQMLR